MLVLVILIGLAASYLVCAWTHGSIANEARSWFETDGLQYFVANKKKDYAEQPIRMWFANFTQDLVSCPFCLMFHVCFWLHTAAWITGHPYKSFDFLLSFAASSAIGCLAYSRMSSELFGE